MAWFSWIEIICCTDLFLDTLLMAQVIATSVLFSFQTAEGRTLEDVYWRDVCCLSIVKSVWSRVKANGEKRKVKYFVLPASALGIWCDPGHSNITLVPLGSPLRM